MPSLNESMLMAGLYAAANADTDGPIVRDRMLSENKKTIPEGILYHSPGSDYLKRVVDKPDMTNPRRTGLYQLNDRLLDSYLSKDTLTAKTEDSLYQAMTVQALFSTAYSPSTN
jgi:hypothetical protein